MEGEMKTNEDKRIRAIANCVDVLTLSIDAMRTSFKDDEIMVKEITNYIDRTCEMLGLLGRREIAEANRLSIKLTKEIEHNMEVERETCDRSVDQ